MIMKSDLVYLDEFFSVPGFIQDEALTFGYQVVSPMINKSNVPDALKVPISIRSFIILERKM